MGVRVLIYDTNERGWPFLSTWWALGSLISGADYVIAAETWADAYDGLAEIDQPLDLVSVWGHGDDGRPLIRGRSVDLVELGQSMRTADPGTELWWRSCQVHRGAKGQRFAEDVTRIVGCVSVGHCVVVSAPNPLWQGAICALRPGQRPWWPADGAGLPGCSTLRMTPPPKAYR
jgi:hypothetical protein